LHTSRFTGFAADSQGPQLDFSSDRLILQQAIQTEMMKFNAYCKMFRGISHKIGSLQTAVQLLTPDGEESTDQLMPSSPPISDRLSSPALHALQEMEDEEERRFFDQEDLATTAGIPEDLTCWNKQTGWMKLFCGKPLPTIQHASLQPKKGTQIYS
jgi:hypothetical protein